MHWFALILEPLRLLIYVLLLARLVIASPTTSAMQFKLVLSRRCLRRRPSPDRPPRSRRAHASARGNQFEIGMTTQLLMAINPKFSFR